MTHKYDSTESDSDCDEEKDEGDQSKEAAKFNAEAHDNFFGKFSDTTPRSSTIGFFV